MSTPKHPEIPQAASEDGADAVVIGRIGSAYGVAGAMHVTSYTEPPENILRYRPWLLDDGKGYREVKVFGAKEHGNGFVARIEGILDRDQAQALAGSLIAVARSSLPALEPQEEFYWRDLVGLRVVDDAGTTLGTVVRMLDVGAHDVLVIDGEREILIPFRAEFVLDVNLAERRILVQWSDPV
jgi:16S rRNA processing protein RimM